MWFVGREAGRYIRFPRLWFWEFVEIAQISTCGDCLLFV
jgi:hypothetical protein